MQPRFFAQPWHDRTGRFSVLKLVVFLAVFAPGLWTVVLYAEGRLGARPLTEIIHQTGLWTLRFMLISLAITPLRRTLQWPRLVLVRRMVGVAAFAYGLALKNAKVSVELHIYPRGGHGYGLRPSPNDVSHWPQRAADWLASQGWLKPR